MRPIILPLLVTCISAAGGMLSRSQAAEPSAVKKIRDAVLYKNDKFYSSFPSIVRRPDGELIAAFRRAPERRALGEPHTTHTDPNSYLMLIRSRDNGNTWSAEPELIFAHPFGGSQDPCMIQLNDQSILCSSYGWALLDKAAVAAHKDVYTHGNFIFLGGYLLKSRDGGHTWQGPILPPPTPGQPVRGLFGEPVPAYNRGAMCQGKDGSLYWAAAAANPQTRGRSETHLLVSTDSGEHWNYRCVISADPKITFNETSLYETPKGDLIAFMRTADFDDHTTLARSTNHGQSFEHWTDAGFQGHPHYALRLPDSRVLLVYGYRHPPFGIRARVLDPECANASTAPELVLRDDGGNGDLGYPWATVISDKLALVVYYFNQADGPRHIAGTFIEIGK